MTVADPEDEATEIALDVRGILGRAEAGWLEPLRRQFTAMLDRERMPHALLLLGRQDAGQLELGVWLAAQLLCDDSAAPACGKCRGCRLFLAGTHPDFHYVGIAADATVIKVDQLRAVSEILALKSYHGGRKVVLFDPADAMNINACNALLKTLEEPSAGTFLILTASRSDRLPLTVVSRTRRVALPLPPAAEALAWLGRRQRDRNWQRLLELANGAPFLALRHAEAGLEALDGQMREALEAAENGHLDLIATAESWARSNPETRLLWLESWLSGRLREAALTSDPVNNNRLPWLQSAGPHSMIPAGYRLLDALREARGLIGGSLNKQLLFEGLLVSLTALRSGVTAQAKESQL